MVVLSLLRGKDLIICGGNLAMAESIVSAMHQAMSVPRGSASAAAEELQGLALLGDGGIVDEADWARAKSLFLGKQPDERNAALEQLRKLHELHLAGLWSDSEFNSKKWDVLVRTN